VAARDALCAGISTGAGRLTRTVFGLRRTNSTRRAGGFAVDLLGPPTIDGQPVGANDWSPFTYIANLTGQPAASVPAGLTEDGLPVGLQIIGRHLADATVLRAAAAFQEAVPQRMPRPSG
jgi:aspartyl-tRNA(Asn)/glutamyl-tRNA(Gln) amidotransferase subunit A